MRVENKVAIVTGAGSGIGEASAIRLAEEGAKVICADINAAAAQATAQKIRETGGTAREATIDISDFQQCDAVVADAIKEFGTVDILVNNAGVNLPGVFHEVSN